MKLNCLALTKSETIRHALISAAGEEWAIAVYEEPAHVFSAHLERLDFLLLDDEVTGPGYLRIVRRLRKRFPQMDVAVVGGPKSPDLMAKEHREGLDYYMARPLEDSQLLAALSHRLELSRIKKLVGIVGRSQRIEEIVETVLLVAPTEVPILIQGESGTGKDIIARTIHKASRRREGPFEAINCASLAEGVLESELFGHEKGSFTGAVSQRKGLFERADSGTVFLDEVGETSPSMQVRLLRVLESGEVLRVGGVKSFKVDVRVIAATNRNLGEAVSAGSFRRDLYFRLKGVTFQLPALRERREDISILVDHFIIEANKKHGRDIKGIEPDALRVLEEYSWPGNVRELKNLVDTVVVLTPSDRIMRDSLEAQLRQSTEEPVSLLPVAAHRTKAEAEREMIYASILALHRDVREILHILKGSAYDGHWEGLREVREDSQRSHGSVSSLSQLEREAIKEALKATGGNRRRAANILGISERTLYRKIKEYGLV